MNLSELKRLVAKGESDTVEFKETLQEEALHTVGAFANTRGGELLLGVNDAGVPVGVDVGKATLREVTDRIASCRTAGIPQPTIAESTGGFLITFRRAKGGAVGPGAVKVGTKSGPSGRHVTGEVTRLLGVMQGEMRRQAIQTALKLRHEDHFREAYLVPALNAQLIEMTIPDKPTSSKQSYRLTEKGRAWLRSRPGWDLKGVGTPGRVRLRYESRKRR